MKKCALIVLCGLVLCAGTVWAQSDDEMLGLDAGSDSEQSAPHKPGAHKFPPHKKAAMAEGAAVLADQPAAVPAAQPEQKASTEAPRAVFNPKSQRDPMLSPDDVATLEARRRSAEAAKEAERLRRLEEERRRAEEAERERLRLLALKKDPTREVRAKISIGGIIDKEVFIGDKIYTVGNSIYGARIVEVRPEEVVFSYKGHTFIKRIPL